MRIGIKVGSKLVTNGGGLINMNFIASLCRQISQLKSEGHEVFLVSSGAVASDGNTNRTDLTRAAIGQGKLIAGYIYHFSMFGYEVAQLLPTYHDLDSGETDFFITFYQSISDPKIIPVINYNDPMDDRELQEMHDFADNDNLFFRICQLAGVDLPIIGFDKDGIEDNNGRIIRKVKMNDREKIASYLGSGGDFGYGKKGEGPKTKVKVLFELAEEFGMSILAPGNEQNFILRAVACEENLGTVFIS